MYSKNELIKIATEIIDLDISADEISKTDDNSSLNKIIDRLKEIKWDLLKDWWKRFGNSNLGQFCLRHCSNTYEEQGGDEHCSLENYIWNKKYREDKYFIFELEARMIHTLKWVFL